MTSRVLLVCGGQDYEPGRLELAWLRGVIDALEIQTVRHGGARGADRWAGKAAKRWGLRVDEVPADWAAHGKAAGPMRNERMLMPDVVAVAAFPGGRGTEHMVGLARKMSFPVVEHPDRQKKEGPGVDAPGPTSPRKGSGPITGRCPTKAT